MDTGMNDATGSFTPTLESSTLSSPPATSPHTLATTNTTENMAYVEIAGAFIAIFLVAIIGNSIVIYVLFRKRHTWTVTTAYLFNLALADAIFVCTLPLWAQTYLNRMEWKFGLAACKLAGVVTSVNMYASIFFLTAMSVDRWVAVVHATSVNAVRNFVRARYMCITIWLSAILLSIPRMIYQILKVYGGHQDTGPKVANSTKLDTDPTLLPSQGPEIILSADGYSTTATPPDSMVVCLYFIPASPHKKILAGMLEFIQAVVGFVIPMTVICICYLRIVHTVRLKLISKRVKKERVAVLAAIVVTAFFVCWLPNQLMTLYSALGGWWDLFPFNEAFYQAVYPFCICLAYANSCVNPFVYAFTATNFKNNIKEVCGSHKKALSYRMTLARGDSRSPFTPKGKSSANNNTSSNVASNKGKSAKVVMIDEPIAESPEHEVRQPLNPAARAARPAEALFVDERYVGARMHENIGGVQPLEDDTTSGMYYEYYSSPPILETATDTKNKVVTTRADIINHNRENSTETHHEWYPPQHNNCTNAIAHATEDNE